jgi:hypothetical protein
MPPLQKPPAIAEPAPVAIPIGAPFRRFSGVSRSKQYVLLDRNELESFMVDGRRMIVVRSWFNYMARQQAAETARRQAGEPAKMKGHSGGDPISLRTAR